MHAAVLHALGKPPRFEEFPDPTPREGEVLINVSAAALKPEIGASLQHLKRQ
jgi:NADPH:quinone reductase-like Zn-dependent oxidoreductase